MFSGIIEEIGKIQKKKFSRGILQLEIQFLKKIEGEIKKGESIAVNGVCLTVEEISKDKIFTASLSQQTREETNLGNIKVGESVNLERALRLGERIGGHFLSGHIDCRGTLLALTTKGDSTILKIKIPEKFRKYVVRRGSIGIEGVSLTVSEIKNKIVSVYLIPYTLENTNLKNKRTGELLNIEVDILAKYVEKTVTNGQLSV